MRHYLAHFSSPGNQDKATVHIEAENIVQAQDKFFEYLKGLPLYQHMWYLNLEIHMIEGSL